MEKVTITIDGVELAVDKNTTILNAANKLDIPIPTLCHLDRVDHNEGSCRICVVEVEGRKNLAPACATPIFGGMKITTQSERISTSRKMILDLIMSDHPNDCLTCAKVGSCKLMDYCFEYGVKETSFNGSRSNLGIDDTNKFYTRDMDKCILCKKCITVCSELQHSNAISMIGRGFETRVGVAFDKGMGDSDSDCVSCGNCIAVCPTGALMDKSRVNHRCWEVERTKTTCPYCGVGCEMELLVKDDKIVGVKPLPGIANDSLLCVKGKFGSEFVNHPDRLTAPLLKKDGKFVEVSWDVAYEVIAEKFKATMDKHGSKGFAGLSSARVTNEENYLFQKMVRAVFGTNNVDHCARLCHASTVAGLATTLGSGAMTNSINEVVDADVIFVTGSNTTETHPVIGAKIKQAHKKGAKIIVAEPRRIELADYADVFLQIRPGTNVALFNGMMNVILTEKLHDVKYIKKRTENFEELEQIIMKYTPERVAEICEIDAEDLKKAARIYAEGDKAGIFYSMGVTQHSTGTQGVMGTSNLALLCGNIGKESAGVNPLRGQNNVQGACDLGALPNVYSGYQKVIDPAVNEKFKKAWKVDKLDDKIGLTVTEIVKASGKDVQFLYIMGENPMISDPDLNNVKKCLESIDFLIVQDIFLTETAKLADLILPATSYAEKDGTFTNTERRIQRVRKAIKPIGEARDDWRIITDVMNKLGYKCSYNSPSDIMDEIASVTPQYGGINYDRIEKVGLQWPCPTKDHPGTKFLHEGKCARGKGLFKPAEYMPSAELPDDQYPMIFTTGRMLYHYHTKTMTGRVKGIDELFPESYIEINKEDASKLDIYEGDKVKVSSRRGEIVSKAVVTEKVPEGTVFMPFHFGDGAANVLTNPVLDPIAKIPELKVCAVDVEKIY